MLPQNRRQRGARGQGGRCDEMEDDNPRNREQALYKTKMCTFYQKGQCKRGAYCSFAHGRRNQEPLPDFYKTRPCQQWRATGTCPNGDECSYAHSKDELRSNIDSADGRFSRQTSSEAAAPFGESMEQFQRESSIASSQFSQPAAPPPQLWGDLGQQQMPNQLGMPLPTGLVGNQAQMPSTASWEGQAPGNGGLPFPQAPPRQLGPSAPVSMEGDLGRYPDRMVEVNELGGAMPPPRRQPSRQQGVISIDSLIARLQTVIIAKEKRGMVRYSQPQPNFSEQGPERLASPSSLSAAVPPTPASDLLGRLAPNMRGGDSNLSDLRSNLVVKNTFLELESETPNPARSQLAVRTAPDLPLVAETAFYNPVDPILDDEEEDMSDSASSPGTSQFVEPHWTPDAMLPGPRTLQSGLQGGSLGFFPGAGSAAGTGGMQKRAPNRMNVQQDFGRMPSQSEQANLLRGSSRQ